MANKSKQSYEIWPKSLLGVMILIVLVLLGCAFAAGQYCMTRCVEVKCASGGAKYMEAETFLAEITDFYEAIIAILFGVIGVILVIGFIYTSSQSRAQAENAAEEAIEREGFKLQIERMLEKQLAARMLQSDSQQVAEDIAELKKQVAWLTSALDECTEPTDRSLSKPGE